MSVVPIGIRWNFIFVGGQLIVFQNVLEPGCTATVPCDAADGSAGSVADTSMHRRRLSVGRVCNPVGRRWSPPTRVPPGEQRCLFFIGR